MELQLRIKMNEKLYVRDPESSELGQRIVRESIIMISKLGFEDFTFKKLAIKLNTTEAGIYRYFENKHRLLVYIISWYWNWMEYLVIFHINNIKDPEIRLKKVIELLCTEMEDNVGGDELDKKALFKVVTMESNKSYLNKDVTINNKNKLFKPYKDLCARIAAIITEINPKYAYPRSMASTLLEMAHLQFFFMHHLPSLTDFGGENNTTQLRAYLESMVFASISQKPARTAK